MYQKCIALFLCVLLLCACNSASKSDPSLSFYYWKLESRASAPLPADLPVRRIYLHIADIFWDEVSQCAIPKAKSRIDRKDSIFRHSITPVIFLDQKIFTQITQDSIATFATKILKMYQDFSSHALLKTEDAQTLQIDCDWLESNRDKYFSFLQELKKQNSQLTLSVTVRLYPYKYHQRMGVPPADFGVLMCYNMDDISKASTKNSIIDVDVLSSYLSTQKYPLPLKPALPMFGWYAWFKPDGFERILYLPNDWANGDHLTLVQSNQFQLSKDTVVQGFYLRRGDVLRNEFPTNQALDKSLSLIKKHFNPSEIILYHWDEPLYNHYEEFIKSNW